MFLPEEVNASHKDGHSPFNLKTHTATIKLPMYEHKHTSAHTRTHRLGSAPSNVDWAVDSQSLAIVQLLHRENMRNTFLKGALSFAVGVLPFLGLRGDRNTQIHRQQWSNVKYSSYV